MYLIKQEGALCLQCSFFVLNSIQIDSTVESEFSKDCEIDPNVKFFFKLPSDFKIPTPIGNYNPD